MQTTRPTLVSLKNISLVSAGSRVLEDVSFDVHPGQHWVLTGPTGSGKTTLAKVIAGDLFAQGTVTLHPDLAGRVHFVEQQHHFRNKSNTKDLYYQQRFNSSDANATITLREAFADFLQVKTLSAPAEDLLRQLHLEHRMDTPLIQLSNGENKRLQLAEALSCKPALLLLDNPFTGLDQEGRLLLHAVLQQTGHQRTTILIICGPDEIPDWVTHVAVLREGRLVFRGPKDAYQDSTSGNEAAVVHDQPAWQQIQPPEGGNFTHAVRMVDVHVSYNGHTILQNINWEIKKGEGWGVFGPNGAGKSTLLSLVTADNPQAYANEIYLFDRKRGSGESIWDIKKRIGYVSPEMHLHFEPGNTCFQVVASGMFDTIGLFRAVSPAMVEQVTLWLSLFHLDRWREEPFWRLSPGRQRMALLARALVKSPPLLVLDEPCQGLDAEQVAFFNELVDRCWREWQISIIYVTHRSAEWPRCITQKLELQAGSQVS